MSRRMARERAQRRTRSHSLVRRLAWLTGIAAALAALVLIPFSAATPAASASSAGSSASSAASTASSASTTPYSDSIGIQHGVVKHVWLIIMENKSYDASFTGLNNNTYLWQTLPSQGVLLKNYYATGHSSQDNYESLVSGQGPQPDLQEDCQNYVQDNNASTVNGTPTNLGVDQSGAVTNSDGSLNWNATYLNNPNFGQWTSGAGANAYYPNNGCVYPGTAPSATTSSPSTGSAQGTGVQTLFNQFDQAGVTWKGYAQDLGDNSNSGALNLTQDEESCGAPFNSSTPNATSGYATPGAAYNSTGYGNPGSASSTGAYVPKHFPFPWFNSLLSNPSKDCTPSTIGPMFGDPVNESAGTNQADFYSDLQSDESNPSSYPNFVWISPNNCSDAHDAECVNGGAAASSELNGYPEGGNLSGGFQNNSASGALSGQDIPNNPTNGTGGLYAGDQFLSHVIPEIEASNEYKQGGLIDVTFDEGYPPFTYNNSFYNDGSYNNGANTSTWDGGNGSGTNYDQLGLTPGASAALGSDNNGETFNLNGTPTSVTSGCTSTAGSSSPSSSITGATNGGIEGPLSGPGTCIPTGPNTPLVTDPSTNEQMSAGPGDAAGLDKPDNCTAEAAADATQITLLANSTNGKGTCILGPQASTPLADSSAKAATQSVTETAGSAVIQDNSIKATDVGRPVTGTDIPTGAFVGPIQEGPTGSCTSVTNCAPSGLTPSSEAVGPTATGEPITGYFTLVNASGGALPLSGSAAVGTSITLAADCDPTPTNEGGAQAGCSGGAINDPYYDSSDQTAGGGLTGSVLISPYITPGTTSTVDYNHYSWLRTMEDLFAVGSTSPGLDGLGHIGYAAQPGLMPFGTDVFNNAPGTQPVDISELRLGDGSDNYAELANTTGSAVNIGGWTLNVALSSGSTTTVTIPSGTSLPAKGHYLIADSGYTGTTTPDQQQSFGGTAVGLQLLTNASTPLVADEVGFSSAPAGYSSGTPLTTPPAKPSGTYAWTRNYSAGALVNTGNNATDFSFVSTSSSDAGNASVGSPTLGAPDPQGLGSPTVHNDVLQSTLLDPTQSASSYPNLSYNASTGTVEINRTLTNCSGQPTTGACAAANPGTTAMTVTRLQFRTTALTTGVLVGQSSPGGTFNSFSVSPLSIEAPSSTTAAGLNSEFLATPDLPSGGLAAGKSINVEFQFKAVGSGSYIFGYNAEDDLVPATDGSSGSGGDTAGSSSSSNSNSSAASSAGATPTPVQAVVSGTVSGTKATATSPAAKKHATKKRATKKHAKKHTTKKHTTKKHAKRLKRDTRRAAAGRHAQAHARSQNRRGH